jgi:ferredoxin-NADP reductase
MPIPPTFEARLVGTRTLSPTVRELVFDRLDGRPLQFEAGQWVSAMLPVANENAPLLKRSYSIASAPEGSPRFEIAVTRVSAGLGSTWLHALEPGAQLRFDGPQGFFTRRPVGAPPSLMIATGTGITPLRSMIRAAVAAESIAPMWLLFGVRDDADLLYGSEWRDLAARYPGFRFEPTLSRPAATWAGRRGYVQAHVRELWHTLASRGEGTPHAFVCGLQRMVGSVRDILRRDLDVAREQVHSERYD